MRIAANCGKRRLAGTGHPINSDPYTPRRRRRGKDSGNLLEKVSAPDAELPENHLPILAGRQADLAARQTFRDAGCPADRPHPL
jgi:hypothetical protein